MIHRTRGTTQKNTVWVAVGYLLLMMAVVLLNGCASVPGNQVADQVAPMTPERELSDAELLNVSIQVFNPGELPEDPDKRLSLIHI